MTVILRDVASLRAVVADWRGAGQVVGVVPTLGALHAGHLSLVAAARAGCDRVIVTIFVNPAQFNNPDDLKNYPRTEAADAALLAGAGVDVIFAPPVAEVYPPGFATKVTVSGVSGPLEGERRPGHFEAVATVVAKLFGMTAADQAFFGQNYWIGDPGYYRLPPASGPYRWVRYYDDVLLVNIYTGEVVDEIHDFYW